MKNPLILTIIVAILVGGVGFFAGMQYQKMQRPNSGQFANGGGGQRMGRLQGQNGNFRPIRGEIVSADDKSITVKMMDGSSKIVILAANVSITEATTAGKEALKSGAQVMVLGTENSDGSITAQNIQLNPQFRGGPNQR